MFSRAALSTLAILGACGASPEAPPAPATTGTTSEPSTEEELEPVVARPGSADNSPEAYCTEVEPNDTPLDATPCGVALDFEGTGETGFYAGLSTIGEDDEVDYYVFRTADTVEAIHQFAWWFEWNDGIDLADLLVYEVAGDRTSYELVLAYETEDTDGENLAFEVTAVRPDTTYLVEVRSVSGVGDYAL